jgi:predicted TIM-barrel fold metal-dependent hydrolase
MTLKVDAHIHVRGPRAASKKWAQLYQDWTEYTEPSSGHVRNWPKGHRADISYEEALRDMDQAGVDKAVIMSSSIVVPSQPGLWMLVQNDYAAEAQACHPDRFVSYAAVNPLWGDAAVAEIDRAINVLGMKGVGEFLPVYNEIALDDERLHPIYDYCQELCRERADFCMNIHVGASMLPWTHLEKQAPALLWKVLEKFPDLRLILAHAGAGGTWDQAVALALTWPNVYLDFTWLPSFFAPFQLIEMLQQAKYLGLLPRCVWGSDYPAFNPASELDMYGRFVGQSEALAERVGREPALTEVDIAGFLGGNVARLLQIT